MQPNHVLDWSSATIEWTSDGYELRVSLVPGGTGRQAVRIAAALEQRLVRGVGGVDLVAVPSEPEDDGDRAQVTFVGAALLTLDPLALRDLVDGVADATANEVAAAEAADRGVIDAWLSRLRSR